MADDRSNDGHMTDFEALMWNLEKDPRLSSNIANMSILDRAPDLDSASNPGVQ